MATKKKAGATCSVVGCKNNTLNSPGTRFYVFSSVYYKQEQTKRWIKAMGRENPDGSPWEPKKYSRICSQHFIGNRKSDHPFSPSFVPTIFPDVKPSASKAKNSAQPADARRAGCSRELSRPGTSSQIFMNALRNPINNRESSPKCKERLLPPQRHQKTQVDFEETQMDIKIFICNRYVNSNICEAEIQACFPLVENLLDEMDRSAEQSTPVTQPTRSKATGPDRPISPRYSLLKSSSSFRGISSITTDREMLIFCGVTIPNFNLLLKILRDSKPLKISQQDRLLIFLLKMKLGLTLSALTFLFNVDKMTISRAFYSTLKFLSPACKNYLLWPSREYVQSTMPTELKKNYANCRVVVNCTKIEVDKPRAVEQRVQLYSDKHRAFTIKVLVGCTPNGSISFVSKCYDGRTSDGQIVSRSGFLKLLEPGDVVLALKDSPEIISAVKATGKEIVSGEPRFRERKVRTVDSKSDDIVTIVRLQTSSTLKRLRSFRILSNLCVKTLPYADELVSMCGILVNMHSVRLNV